MPSDFRQCKLCGKIYRYAGSVFCPACVQDIDKHFRLVKDFLYKNRNMTIAEVAEQTGTDERIILHFLKEGRLEMTTAGDFLRCESCGTPITTGRLCSKCASGLSAALDGAVQQRPARSRPQISVDKLDKSDRPDRSDKSPDISYGRMHTKNYIEKNKRR